MSGDHIIDNTERPMTVKWKKPNALALLRQSLVSTGVTDAAEEILPGVEAIGAGYNPFLEYASADSITVQLFDWSKGPFKKVSFNQKYKVPEIVDVQQHDRAIYSNISGSSINSFQKTLGGSVGISGDYNLFSGSLTVEFAEQSLTKSENEFTRIQQTIDKWSLRLPVVDDLKKYLSTSIKDHFGGLQKTDAAAMEFFNRFGSHFLAGIVMGGRAVYSSATNKLRVDRSYSIETEAQASYEFLTGQISAEAKAKYQTAVNSFNMTSESTASVVGGDAIKAVTAFDGKGGFAQWRDSVGTSPDFVQFVGAVPLVGIWTLFPDKDTAKFYENFFNMVWAPEQSRKYQYYPNYIDSMIVINGGNSGIQPPVGYTKIPFDLNSDAGGDYIYLCTHSASYNKTGPNKDCIDDVKIIFGKNAPAPAGYTKLDLDLNKGAGGEYVYLCYRRVPYNNSIAIKGVTVLGGSSPNVPAPYQFVQVPGDLNEGAGGDYVYVYISKEA